MVTQSQNNVTVKVLQCTGEGSSCMMIIIFLVSLSISNRSKQGRVLKSAPFQGSAPSGEVTRIEPNKKWFGKSCILYTHH